MANLKKWDWDTIKLDYMIGEKVIDKDGREIYKTFTLKRISEKYGIPTQTLREKCNRDKWVHQRNMLDSKLKRQMTEGKVTQLLGEATINDTVAIHQLSKINKLIYAYFEQFPEVFATDANEPGTITEIPRINPRELKDLVGVIKEAHTLSSSILDGERMQQHMEEIQTKEKAKTNTRNPKQMEEKIQHLLAERMKLQENIKSELQYKQALETKAVTEINTFNTDTVIDIESQTSS